MSEQASEEWIMEYFHPTGLQCPHCEAGWAEASEFRTTRRSQLTVYRCRVCRGIYNLYSGTIFEARQLRPAQVVLLVRGVLCQHRFEVSPNHRDRMSPERRTAGPPTAGAT
jgi:hypothetical protein